MRFDPLRCTVAVLLALSLLAVGGRNASSADEEAGWRKEFYEVCGSTADAEALSTETLKSLLERCERLQPRIERLEDPERKIMRTRLKMCCNLYRFMVETRMTSTR